MNRWLLRFFGLRVAAARVSSASVRLQNAEMLGWAVFLLLLLGGLAWWSYFRQPAHAALSQGKKRLLTALRFFLFLLIALLFLQPVVVLHFESHIRQVVAVLVDATSSMNLRDPRTDEADLKRAEIAAGVLQNMDQKLDPAHLAQARGISRAELVAQVFRNKHWHLLDSLSRDFQVEVFTFGESTAPGRQGAPDWLDRYHPSGKTTALGDAVRDAAGQERSEPLAGIFLVTDGGNNSGSPPIDAAAQAGRNGAPLYIYGVGTTSPRDIVVSGIDAPGLGFARDEMEVTVHLRGQSLAGETAHLVLKLGDHEVAATDVTFTGEAQEAPLRFTPTAAGQFTLTASIASRPDEISAANNAASRPVRIIESRIKVLYIEQAPRWEFRFLQAALSRDRRVQPSFVLANADSAIADAPPYLPKFPAENAALFQYDLLIVGDVDPKVFAPARMEAVTDFVSKFGGACLFIAGKNFMPAAFRGTPFEKMLPVEIAPPGGAGPSEREIHLARTSAGRESPMLRLASDAASNDARWSRLPSLAWDFPAGPPKPGAQVLLEDSDPALATRFGKMPVLATQQFGAGQVFYLGTDNLWRWRRNEGVEDYPRLWGQLVQGAAMAHLLGGSKRAQLSSDKQEYKVGEPVTIFARLYDEKFQPLAKAAGQIWLEGAEQQPLELRAVPGRPGNFRGTFVASRPGRYRFQVTDIADAKLDFSVVEPRDEMRETAMNEALLKQMAEASGGRFFREEDLSQLAPAMVAKPATARDEVEAGIWSSPFYFVLICAVATTEWIVRKRSNLR